MADPPSYDGLFEAAGQYYNVDPQLIKTIWHKENKSRPVAPRGAAGEIGPMQIMPDTAHHLGVGDPNDMASSVMGAAKYLREGLDANQNDPVAAVRFYNGGPNGPTNPKTQSYANDVIRIYPTMAMKQTGQDSKSSDFEKMGADLLEKSTKQGPTSDPFSDIGSKVLETGSHTKSSDPFSDIGSKILETRPPQATPSTQTAESPPQQTSQTAPPEAASPLDNALGVGGIRNALSGQPGDYQFGGVGAFLPLAHNDVTGQNRLAVPQVVNNLGNGVLDLIEGPNTGTVTPQARGALLNMALGGRLNPQAADLVTSEGNMLSSQFRKEPFTGDYNPMTPKGLSSDVPSMKVTPNIPKPDASSTSIATNKFLDYIQNIAAHKLTTAAGAGVGAVLGGPIGAAAGGLTAAFLQPIIRDAIKGMAPEQQKAVMEAFAKRIAGQRPGDTPEPTDNKLQPKKPTAPNGPVNYLMPNYAPQA